MAKFCVTHRLSGGRRGIAFSCSASHSNRFIASAQVWCLTSHCFHSAGESTNLLPQRQQMCGGCISGCTSFVALLCICATSSGGEGESLVKMVCMWALVSSNSHVRKLQRVSFPLGQLAVKNAQYHNSTSARAAQMLLEMFFACEREETLRHSFGCVMAQCDVEVVIVCFLQSVHSFDGRLCSSAALLALFGLMLIV